MLRLPWKLCVTDTVRDGYKTEFSVVIDVSAGSIGAKATTTIVVKVAATVPLCWSWKSA